MKALATAALLGLAFTYEDNEYFKSDKLHQPIHRPIHPIRPKNHTNHTIRPIHPIHHPIKPIHPRNHTLRPITRPIYTAIPDVHVPTHRPPRVPRGVLVKDHTKKTVQNDDEFFAFDEDEFMALAEDEFFSFEDDELFSFFRKKNTTQHQGRKNATHPYHGRKNRTDKPKPLPLYKKLLQNDDDEFFAFDEDEFFTFDDDELFSFFKKKNATQIHKGRKNRTERAKPIHVPKPKKIVENDDDEFFAFDEDEFFAFDDDELFSFFRRKNATQRQGRKNATHPHHGRKNMTQLHYGRKNQTERVKPIHVPHPKKLVQKDDDEFFAFEEDEFFAFDEDEFFAFDDDELFSFFKKKNGTQPHKGRKNRTERAKPIHVPKPKKIVENDDDEFFAFDEDEFFAFDDDEFFSFFNRRNGTRKYHGRKNHTEHPRFHPLRKTVQNDDDEFFIFSNKKNHTRKDRDPRKHVPLHKIPHFNLTALKNRPRIPARPRKVVENDDDEFFAFDDDLELFDMDHFGDNELKSKFFKGVGNFFKKHGPTLINIGTKLIGLDDDELFVEGLTDHELGIIKNIGDLIKKKVGFDDFADDSLVHLGDFIKDGLKVKDTKAKNYHDLLKTIKAPGKGK